MKRLSPFLAAGLAALSLASSASAQSLKVQFRPTWISTGDNQLALVLNVVNTGSTALALSTVTVRYYFTRDTSASLTAFCDYTQRGCGNVTTSFGTVSPATTTADSYLQLAFGSGAGSLSAGQTTGDIQLRVAKSDWSNFDETNDYSYAGNASLTDSTQITGYVSGALVWGTAPGGTTTPDFSLAASPATLTVNRGASGAVTVNVTRTSFTSALSCSASGLPSGVTASFSPTSVTGNSTALTLAASSSATVGTSTVTVTCTGGGLSRTASIALTVGTVTTPDFSLTASPATLTVNRGTSGATTINVARTSFTSALSCSARGLSSGVTASFRPTSVTGNSTALTLAASSSATVGTVTVTVTCSGGGLTRTTAIVLTVGTGTTPDFSLAASPATLSVVAGASAVSTVTITRTSFTSAVALTASGLPTGVTATFSPASTTGTSSNVTFAAASSAAAATATVTLTGTSGTLSRTATVRLTVTTAGCTGTACGWRVANGRITHDGSLFRFHCGSWFGLQGRYEIASDAKNPRGAPMEQYIGNTFWAQGGQGTGRTIAGDYKEMKAAGINVIRLPLVHQTLDANDPQGRDPVLKNYSSVRIANSRLALETMIKEAASAGVYLLLDIHSCSNYVDWRKGRFDAHPPWVDANRSDYDYKREDCSCASTNNPSTVTRVQAYNSSLWLQDLQTIAGLNKALGVDAVMGIDIYNEPWDYSWSEWKGFIEQAYATINAADPRLLVFAQGISGSHGNQTGVGATPAPTPYGAFSTMCQNAATSTTCSVNPNWGENLYEAGDDPPNVPKEKLVFSPHAYGPSVAVQPQFLDSTQSQCAGLQEQDAANAKCQIVINPTLLRRGWEEHFGYLKDLGYAVIVGEWGGNYEWPGGKASQRDRNLWGYLTSSTTDLQWQEAFTDYMVEKGIESCYWSINPESGDTGGWYTTPYDPSTNTGGWGEWGAFDSTRTRLLQKVWNGIP
jgi:aryl-phospho-beta-D-glucosidase BglC (GH1 family)